MKTPAPQIVQLWYHSALCFQCFLQTATPRIKLIVLGQSKEVLQLCLWSIFFFLFSFFWSTVSSARLCTFWSSSPPLQWAVSAHKLPLHIPLVCIYTDAASHPKQAQGVWRGNDVDSVLGNKRSDHELWLWEPDLQRNTTREGLRGWRADWRGQYWTEGNIPRKGS